MGIKEKIYQFVPVSIQHALVSLYGWQWRKRRFGGVFEEELKGYKERERYTALQWEEYNVQQLRKMLLHAYDTVPFYKERWTKLGITAKQLEVIDPSSLKQLPFLEKDELRKFGKTTLLSSTLEKGGSFFASSGSTGTPTSIMFSHPMHQRWSAAYEARVRHWAGVDRLMARGMIGGRRILPDSQAKPPYYRYNFFEKQVYFSAYHISPDTVSDYLEAIKKHKIDYMVGYAMSNFFLARFIKEQGLKAPKLKAVITSSEKLTQEMRDTFAEVYGCKTYDGYSGVEACGLITECEHGGLHISPEVGLFEIIDEHGNEVAPGEMGEVVCTGFINYDQPLIRYRIGDYVIKSDRKCSCGREMPMVEEIVGRFEDVVIGKDGREMVRFHGIFIDIDAITQGQVIQEDLDNMTLNVAVSQPLSAEDKALLESRVFSQLGNINIDIVEVEEIPKGANGKFRAVISKVKRQKAQ